MGSTDDLGAVPAASIADHTCVHRDGKPCPTCGREWKDVEGPKAEAAPTQPRQRALVILLDGSQDEGTTTLATRIRDEMARLGVDAAVTCPADSPLAKMLEAAGRENADRAARNFKALLAKLEVGADLVGLVARVGKATLSANYGQDGEITSVTLSGPGGLRRLAVQPGPEADRDELLSKINAVSPPEGDG